MREWKVLFEENYWGSHCADDDAPAREAGSREKVPMSTTEHRINELVEWYGETWKLLSLYTCPEGLVLDTCKKIDVEELRAFTGRYDAANFDGDHFDEELFARIQLDNPTMPYMEVGLCRGGQTLPSLGSSSLVYVPEGVENRENDPVALLCMAHYGLDTGYGWIFSRSHYSWDRDCSEDLSGLAAVLGEREIELPGEHFHLTGGAQRIPLTHPVSGVRFELCIEKVEAQEMKQETLNLLSQNEDVEMLYPTYFESVSYYTEPEIPDGSYFLRAQAQGDSPVMKNTDEPAAMAVAVIGGSSGPVSVFVAGKADNAIRRRSVCSPLFFKPTQVRDWRISYMVKRREPLRVELHTV